MIKKFLPPSHQTDSSSIVLNRRTIYIVPTGSGLLFSLMLIMMLIGATNYRNSMGYLLTFWLGSLALVSTLHTQRMLLGLRVEAGKVSPVFAGETAQFQLWLDNRGHPARYALVCQYNSCFKDDWKLVKFDAAHPLNIPAHQRVSLTIPVPTTQRGRLFLGKVTFFTRFPLGLFHVWTSIHLDVSTLVYPRPLGQRILPISKMMDHLQEGSLHRGAGEDFIGHRNYQVGDSPRHIDWKVVAKEQAWLVKQFGGKGANLIWFTWEEVSGLNHIELALSQLCLWILVAESQGVLYGLKIPGCTLEPHTGEQHRDRCLQALALFGETS